MNIYDKGLLDDTRNYMAMHYEYNKILGNTTTQDPYHSFDAPLLPSYSLNRLVIRKGSRVKITNFNVVSTGKPIVKGDNATLAKPTSVSDYIAKIPKHILEYSRIVKASKLAW